MAQDAGGTVPTADKAAEADKATDGDAAAEPKKR
jgi:hypothetical protein